MRTLKFLAIFCSLLLYLICGVLTRIALLGASPYTAIKAMNRLKYCLMNLFKHIAGLKISVTGELERLKEKGLFIISNHIGYIDGIVLGTLIPATFTTKDEIKKMPFLGNVVAIDGSIFIDRTKRNEIIHYVNRMADHLKNDINIINFPEGHATDGTKVLSFFPAFFDAPLKTRSTILPITIDYQKINGKKITNSDDIYCYDGKVPLLKHLWNLLKFKSIEIVVRIHDTIEPNGHQSDAKGRKLISNLCNRRLSEYKNLPISDDHPIKRSYRPVEVPS